MKRSNTKITGVAAISLFALLLGLGAPDTRADGTPKVSMAERPALSWSGVYVGAHVGWGRLDVDRYYPVDEHYVQAGTFIDQSADGTLYGGHIGYNHQIGALVAGGEVSVSRAEMSVTGTYQGYPADPPVRLTTKLDTLVTATARLGVAHGPFLLFAKAGYAAGDIGTRSWDPTPHWSQVSRWTSGWLVGAGGEVALHKNVTWSIEYNFIEFDADTHNAPVEFSAAAPAPPRFQNVDINTELHVVTTRLNFRFGP